MKYEVVEHRYWLNTITGQRVGLHSSLGGSEIVTDGWKIVADGWTLRYGSNGESGIGQAPFATRAEAEAWLAAYEARQAEYRRIILQATLEG